MTTVYYVVSTTILFSLSFSFHLCVGVGVDVYMCKCLHVCEDEVCVCFPSLISSCVSSTLLARANIGRSYADFFARKLCRPLQCQTILFRDIMAIPISDN